MTTSTKQTSPATPAQLSYINSLAKDRLFDGSHGDGLTYAEVWQSDGLKVEDFITTKRGASRLIDSLLASPKKPNAAVVSVPQDTVHPKAGDGRYAVEVDGKLCFFKVRTPTEGKWAGYTFVAQMASDEEYPVKGDRRKLVLDLIGSDEQAAMVRFGQEIGQCGHCGRTLTDEASRAAGIGPVCAGKLGW